MKLWDNSMVDVQIMWLFLKDFFLETIPDFFNSFDTTKSKRGLK